MSAADAPASALRLGPAERALAYAVGRRYLRDPDAAEDVAQDAMLLAHRHREQFRGAAHPHTWLYRVAASAALEDLRRRRRRAGREEPIIEAGPEPSDPTPTADDAIAARERVDLVQRSLAGLADKYAEVLRLRIAEVDDREIAARLGISVSAVKVRAHRARNLLRAALADAA